ncbi:MAG: transglutaminase-like domain-containing protein [Gammaproteobacteria bacterium]|nr:transglutaminase-like domain-containing protein [Gammaproteobacteria bacterium]
MSPGIEAALRDFLATDEDPVEGALIVARILDADADVDWAREEVAAIADRVAVADRHGPFTPTDLVAAVAAEGFKGAGDRYYEVDNSILDRVLRNRRGIPISLGVVLIGVARHLGFDAQGVNFPRHFLVTIDDLLVDPYAVAPTTLENCRKWLADNNVGEQGAFDLTRPKDVVLRMLNNARILIQNRGDFVRALDISDYQLLVVPDYYGLYVERADAWLGLNAPEMVVEELEKAAERAPDEKTAERLRERIAQAKRLGGSEVN